MAKSKTQNKTGKRQIARLESEVGKQLRQIATEKGVTAQALMGEALDYLSSKYGVTQPMKRLTIDVPADLYHRLSAACAQRHLKITDVVLDLLAREFSRDQGGPIESSGQRDGATPIESSGQRDGGMPIESSGQRDVGAPTESSVAQLETTHHEPIVGLGDFR